MLSALCDPGREAELTRLILRESTSLGVRRHAVSRTMLQREHVTVRTEFGDIPIKRGRDPQTGEIWNAAPSSRSASSALQRPAYRSKRCSAPRWPRIATFSPLPCAPLRGSRQSLCSSVCCSLCAHHRLTRTSQRPVRCRAARCEQGNRDPLAALHISVRDNGGDRRQHHLRRRRVRAYRAAVHDACVAGARSADSSS